MWTRSEDAEFDKIIIDADCFNHFAFTMTSLGIQIGSGINNVVGGYATGILSFDNGTPGTIGVFQFGAPLTGTEFFAQGTSANTFPNNSTTQGWALLTSKARFSPASTIDDAGGNADIDYAIYFRNNGANAPANLDNPEGQDIVTETFDLNEESAETDPQDFLILPFGHGVFLHFVP
jgi:hypothetical protein